MNKYFIWEVIQRSRSEGQGEKQDRRRSNIRKSDKELATGHLVMMGLGPSKEP